MNEILQSDEVKLYEYDQYKPDLNDMIDHCGITDQEYLYHYNHNHDPRNGQFTSGSGGVTIVGKKNKKGGSPKKKSKEDKKIYKTKEQAMADKDLEYVKEHVDDFSTKELNDLLNRINVESRLDEAISKNSPSNKKKVKKIMSSPAFKFAAALAISSLSYAAYNGYKGVTANPPRLTDKSNPYSKQFTKDMLTGAGKHVGRTVKKKAGIK